MSKDTPARPALDAMPDLLAVLDYFEQREDIIDNNGGPEVPNEEMKLAREVTAAIKEVCKLRRSLADMRGALEDVKSRIEKSEHWWMDEPNRGGFDLDMIKAALARIAP